MTGKAPTKNLSVPKTMKAWVLDGPEQLRTDGKAGSGAGTRRGPGADRRGFDLRHRRGNHHQGAARHCPGRLPFNKNFTPGHEYMGTVVKLGAGVDEYKIGDRDRRGDPCRVRALRAMPEGDVHLLPELRPELRRPRQGPPRQRLHHRRRFRRVRRQPYQYPGPRRRTT